MKKIVLISCSSKKMPHKTKAQDLYISALFRGNLRYAKSQKPDYIFVLSAKYGLLELDREIEPYDVTLKDMSSVQVRAWANVVLGQLGKRVDLRTDHFILLAGSRYRKYLVPQMASYETPLQGMAIGKQLQYLAAQNYGSNLS
jgi:hypothetical protein